ncbi:MAG: amidohydrolase [Firmicutes bacterium]|nr:amidohydrolase [Bacillota bacterium]
MRVLFLLSSCLAFVTLALVHSAPTSRPAAATLVVRNGRVWTGDRTQPRAEAVAIAGERIVAVGTNTEIAAWIRPETEVLDARGHSVLPGLIDAHVHFSSGGLQLTRVDLRDAATPEEFARRIGEFAKRLPAGEWILGGTWDHELWGGDPLPHRSWIDSRTAAHPVFVRRYDGHMGLANTLALERAGITRQTPDPPGGVIVRDADGTPTGVLKDAAMELVERVIPEPSEEQRTRAVLAALAEANRFGLTGVHDISSPADLRVYQALRRQGRLTVRIYSILPIAQWESLAAAGIRARLGDDWLKIGALKAFTDGSLGSSTALFFAPYLDAPETSGLAMHPEPEIRRMILGADRAGLQLCIHAIGDRANRMILEAYAEAARQNPPWDGAPPGTPPGATRRWRIEHAQHLHPDDFARFARLGVIASMQPYHAIDDGRWAEKRIGTERCRTTYAFRSLLDAGVVLAFGSDWTVAPLNPLTGIYAAVTRRTLDGKHPDGWFPEQKITLEEALTAYTVGSAYAEFAETTKGTLTPGKLGDLVVLDADLFALPAEAIADVKVRFTVVGGRVVYRSEE